MVAAVAGAECLKQRRQQSAHATWSGCCLHPGHAGNVVPRLFVLLRGQSPRRLRGLQRERLEQGFWRIKSQRQLGRAAPGPHISSSMPWAAAAPERRQQSPLQTPCPVKRRETSVVFRLSFVCMRRQNNEAGRWGEGGGGVEEGEERGCGGGRGTLAGEYDGSLNPPRSISSNSFFSTLPGDKEQGRGVRTRAADASGGWLHRTSDRT